MSPSTETTGRGGIATALIAAPALIGLLAAGVMPSPDPEALASTTTTSADAPVFSSDAGQVQVYFGNLHSHTGLSDGSANPRTAYQHARDVAKLDFIAITEHNHAQAGRIQNDPDLYADSLIAVAAQFMAPGRFVPLYGQEFSTIKPGNHGNVIDAPEVIMTSDVPNNDWRALLENWLPNHRDSEGQQPVLLLNHPMTSGSPFTKQYGRTQYTQADWIEALDARATLMNMVNGPSHKEGDPPGKPSETRFLAYLNLGFHFAPTADQDNHLRNWGDAADTRTAVVAPELTKTAVLRALRNRQVYATEDRNLRIMLKVGGRMMGSRFTTDLPAVGDEIAIALTIHDDDEPSAEYQIDVYSDLPGGDVAEIVQTATAQGNGSITIPGVLFEGEGQYVFVRVTQTDQDDQQSERAWLAPVWFESGGVTEPASSNERAVLLEVDAVREEALITNAGSAEVDLSGWKLVSTRGDQHFTFPTLRLAPGASVKVVSGPGKSPNPPRVLVWSAQRIWANDNDPGELYDAQNNLMARTDDDE